MTILVTGATGNVGRQIVEHLVKRGADVRALVRDPSKAQLPAEVSVVPSWNLTFGRSLMMTDLPSPEVS